MWKWNALQKRRYSKTDGFLMSSLKFIGLHALNSPFYFCFLQVILSAVWILNYYSYQYNQTEGSPFQQVVFLIFDMNTVVKR